MHLEKAERLVASVAEAKHNPLGRLESHITHLLNLCIGFKPCLSKTL